MNDRNENRPGYKKTKVGWIPEEWECSALSRCKDYLGSGISRPFFDDKTKGIPVLRSNNVQGGKVNSEDLKYWFNPDPRGAKLDPVRPQNGDVLINFVNGSRKELGKAGVYRGAPANCIVSTNFFIFRAKHDKCDSSFLGYHFTSDLYRRWLHAIVGFSGPGSFNQQQLSSHTLPLPPLPEQEAIAEVLGCWDEGIRALEYLIEQKRLRKKGLMQKLLTGGKRLPAFQKSEDRGQRTEHRFFNIPSDWTLPQLKEVAKESTERNKNSAAITVLSCSKHRGFVESSQYFKKQVFSDDTTNYKVIKRNEFGFPSNHIEEGSIGLLTTHDKGIVSPIYTVFKTNEKVLPTYLFALFKTETYKHIFKINTNGSVDRRGSLRWKEFGLIRMPLPTLAEQKAIAEVLATADEEIGLLGQELDALREHKKGLMQKLLTGEKRLPAFQRSEDSHR